MPELTILYDGWPLARQPNSAAGLHLATLLAHHPEETRVVVALPTQPDDPLPEGVVARILPAAPGPYARLRWEQRMLPGLAQELDAQVIHLTSGHPALFGPTAIAISPTESGASPAAPRRSRARRGLAARLREALGQGGRSQADGIFWPSDLPVPESSIPILTIPPAIHPAFTGSDPQEQREIPELELPQTYVLYHGPHTSADLQRLLAAWSWVAAPIGEYYPLLLLGLDDSGREALRTLTAAHNLGETVRSLPNLSLSSLVKVYQNCEVLFHPAHIAPWGSPLRAALACGKPVVALDTPLADALVGPAAYLVPGEDSGSGGSRVLGAALLTVIVEQSVADALSEAARQRATRWTGVGFGASLLAAYRAISQPAS